MQDKNKISDTGMTFTITEERTFENILQFKNEIKWINFIAICVYHAMGVYWVCHYAFPAKWQTLLYALVTYVVISFGITCGAHRLWTHRSYKAKSPLKLFLLVCFAGTGQNSLYNWVRDHRVHHKFSDTDADPHNINRGLFFAHIGWLMMKKNKEVIRRGKQVDMSDIGNDAMIQVFERYFSFLKLMFCFVLPTTLNIMLWEERWQCAVAWQCFIRYLATLHSELTVNSLAHFLGYRPYNKNIAPAENGFVAAFTLGEGWHNYHHTFPFDYKSAEYCDVFNLATVFIRICAKIGLAFDLKEATQEMINSQANRAGDGTHVYHPIELPTSIPTVEEVYENESC